jgi:capsid protein
LTDVISLTGNGDDIEDMLKKRLRELELAKEKDLVFDTDPGVDASGKPPAPEPAAPAPQPEDNANPDGETAAPGRVVSMRVSK